MPLYRFLSGGAATGKSYVLQALRETAECYFKSQPVANFQSHWCMTVAPTGKTAFLAGELQFIALFMFLLTKVYPITDSTTNLSTLLEHRLVTSNCVAH